MAWSPAASPTTVTGTAPAIRAEHVAGSEAEPDDDRVGRGRGFGAGRRVGGDDRADPAGGRVRVDVAIAFETHEPPADRASPTYPAGGEPTATTRPRSTPASCSRSAARAVTIPASRLPGQTGWISAAPVATTISCGWTWSIPPGVRTTIIGPA